jgi:hypothetical protein
LDISLRPVSIGDFEFGVGPRARVEELLAEILAGGFRELLY